MHRETEGQCDVGIKPMVEMLGYRTFTVGCEHKDVAMITHNPVNGICLISLFLGDRTAFIRCHADGRITLDMIHNDIKK